MQTTGSSRPRSPVDPALGGRLSPGTLPPSLPSVDTALELALDPDWRPKQELAHERVARARAALSDRAATSCSPQSISISSNIVSEDPSQSTVPANTAAMTPSTFSQRVASFAALFVIVCAYLAIRGDLVARANVYLANSGSLMARANVSSPQTPTLPERALIARTKSYFVGMAPHQRKQWALAIVTGVGSLLLPKAISKLFRPKLQPPTQLNARALATKGVPSISPASVAGAALGMLMPLPGGRLPLSAKALAKSVPKVAGLVIECWSRQFTIVKLPLWLVRPR